MQDLTIEKKRNNMNFKKRRKHSRIRCGQCAGQRRRFGEKELTKKKLKIMDKELNEIKSELNKK